ncbi:MAG: sulfotransferase [Anaerolineae bacterium]|nr:sulfotransferase [Anaerolineae bacterium]
MYEITRGPIFIVGCGRSGTTLLQRMLDAHPEIAIAPETEFILRFWLYRDRYGDLGRDENYCQLIADIVAMPEFSEMRLDGGSFCQDAWHLDRGYAALFGLLLKHFAQVRHVDIVGEKTPRHVRYMNILERFFPAARFIHIVRDPRAVVESRRRVPWSTGSVSGDANMWRLDIRLSRRNAPLDASSLYTLHYERLVQAPEESLREICRFLGVEFDSAMLGYYRHEPVSINLEREPWKLGVTQPVTQTTLERWRSALTPSQIAEIEAVVWPEMGRFGYQVQTPWWQLLPRIVLRMFPRFRRRIVRWAVVFARMLRLIPPESDRRAFLFELLPDSSVCAEIGVLMGDFSEQILRAASPQELHLIDTWKYEPFEVCERFLSDERIGVIQHGMDRCYTSVCSRFESDILLGRVTVHRNCSGEALTRFPDAYFDWVYIDKDHRYASVKQDLDLAFQKTKPGGYVICGDHIKWGWWLNDVTKAVNEFVKEESAELVLVRNDQFVVRKRQLESRG